MGDLTLCGRNELRPYRRGVGERAAGFGRDESRPYGTLACRGAIHRALYRNRVLHWSRFADEPATKPGERELSLLRCRRRSGARGERTSSVVGVSLERDERLPARSASRQVILDGVVCQGGSDQGGRCHGVVGQTVGGLASTVRPASPVEPGPKTP